MSVHLYLYPRDQYVMHPDWEPLFRNNVGHKHFARGVFKDLPSESFNNDAPGGIDWLYRPTDFNAWREAIKADPELADTNLLAMVDILERAPDYWLSVSQ